MCKYNSESQRKSDIESRDIFLHHPLGGVSQYFEINFYFSKIIEGMNDSILQRKK